MVAFSSLRPIVSQQRPLAAAALRSVPWRSFGGKVNTRSVLQQYGEVAGLTSNGPLKVRMPHIISANPLSFRQGWDVRFQSSSGEAVHPVNVPSMGDSISEGSLNHWTKQIGDYVAADEVIAVIDTDKISVDINCPVGGILTSVEAQEGDTVFVGNLLFTVDTSGAPPSPSVEMSTTETITEESNEMSHEKSNKTTTDSPPSKSSPPVSSKMSTSLITSPDREESRVKMTRMRQRIAERLKSAQNTAAALTTFNEVDMTGLMTVRSELNDLFKETHGTKLGFMSAFMMASARALLRMPEVNASIDGSDILYRNYADISVAVSTPTGLMVPVIRDCDKKSLADLEKELADLASRARKGQIALEDMAGGTFTISNGGVYGSLIGTPLLNPPQSAILGMHGIMERPVVKNGQIVIRPMMYLALTYDHRIVDGREGVLFLKLIKESLEDPRRLLLEI